MSAPAGQGCGSCLFCNAVPVGDGELRMVCRRMPPQVTALLLPTNRPPGYEIATNMAWPMVSKDQWCGEWQAEEQASRIMASN